jgi:hypothetical protein
MSLNTNHKSATTLGECLFSQLDPASWSEYLTNPFAEQKIHLIKHVWQRFNVGLYEAKLAVELYFSLHYDVGEHNQ